MHIQFLYRQNTFNLSKQTFCYTELKFQTPRTVSNGNHFLHIYSFCVENKKFMVFFSILIQYFTMKMYKDKEVKKCQGWFFLSMCDEKYF